MQVPLKVQSRWTVLCIDLKHYMHDLIFTVDEKILGEKTRVDQIVSLDYFIKSFLICCKVTVRGIYVSNILFTPQTLPKEMSFALPKDKFFEELYSFSYLPDVAPPLENLAPGKPRRMRKREAEDDDDEEVERVQARPVDREPAPVQPIRETKAQSLV